MGEYFCLSGTQTDSIKGCGVTPQVAVMAAADKIAGKVMAHKPGHMLILDVTEEDLFATDRGLHSARSQSVHRKGDGR